MLHIEEQLNSHVYKQILENVMLPSVRRVFPNDEFIFQQDNCPIHTAHIVAAWFKNYDVNVQDGSSRSPDLNPIENMWGLLVKKLRRQPLVFSKDDLLVYITDMWYTLPKNYNKNLWFSMSRRLAKVVEANGPMPKY